MRVEEYKLLEEGEEEREEEGEEEEEKTAEREGRYQEGNWKRENDNQKMTGEGGARGGRW